MKPADPIHDALQKLEPPEIDLDRSLDKVHRRVRRTRVLRLGAPVAAALLIIAVSVTVLVNRNSSQRLATVRVLSSHEARDATTPTQASAGADAVNAFSLDLFKQVADGTPGNLVLSPYSVDQVLSMAFAGARGTTRDQIAKVLHVGADEGKYHQALNALDRQLAAPRQGQEVGSDPEHPGKALPEIPPVALHVADSVWVQRGFAVERAFLDQLARSYGAGVHTVDFAEQADASRLAINDWVAEHTKGRIKDLLAKDDIDSLTRLVLVNAVTFSGRWVTQFDAPIPRTFTTSSGGKVTAPMMQHSNAIGGASGDGWRSASIPYVGGAHLLVILPDDLDAYASALTPEKFKAADSNTNQWESLLMPSFETTTRAELTGPLTALGMSDAFEPSKADFSGIAPDSLVVGAVVQQARVKIDQFGTEAEAATAMTFQAVGKAIGGPEPLVLDHPFMYAIVDDATGAILFMGRVDDPTATS